MALAGPQSNRPFLPAIPRQLPKTQADWEQVANAFLNWQGALSPVWTVPTLQNGWVNFGTPYEPAGYYMDVSGRVYLRGMLKSGTVGSSTPVFTLPAGYAPPYDVVVPIVTSADVFGEVRVASGTAGGGARAGAVAVWSGSNAWISLAGISFGTAP